MPAVSRKQYLRVEVKRFILPNPVLGQLCEGWKAKHKTEFELGCILCPILLWLK